ncbi:MAG: hypothetical protein ACM31C_00320 [Acidobacteriota bacterium]
MRALAGLVVLAAAATSAHADDAILRGNVVKVEAKEIYVDLGRDRGVSNGAALRLKRTISLRHPVTHAMVDDWIPIGSASITQAGSVMSRAVVGELVTDVKVGDVAEVLVAGAAAPPPAPAPAGTPPPQVDPQTAEVLQLFAQQAGQPLDARIASWEHFLSTRPGSPYAEAIRRDLDTLHQLREQLRPPTVARDSETIATVQHAALASAPAGVAVPVVFVLDQPEHVASAYLHFRPHGAPTYRSILLARENNIYLRGVIPADVVAPPGFDYFVEVSTPAGRSGLALASPEQPISVIVAGPPIIERFASKPGRSGVRLGAEYLDFATFDKRAGDHRDYMVQATTDFTYRLDDVVESLGVGYGVYAAGGGYADRVWTMDSPLPKGGFDYGYGDIELGGQLEHVHVSTGAQLIAGVGRAGFGMGFEGRLRIGDRDATNLVVSARTVDQVGWLSLVRFGTRLADAVKLGVLVAATDQPNDGDVGVKLGTELELLSGRSASLLLRASWQGRSVDHGGLGGGAGLGVFW